MRLLGSDKVVNEWVVLKHSEKILASDIFIPNRDLSYSIPTCFAPYVNVKWAKF